MDQLSHFKDALVIHGVPTPNGSDKTFAWTKVKMYSPDNVIDSHPKTGDLPDFKTDYTPQAKDKVFFFPGCNCPRFKVRPWLKKNNASVTINLDNATVFVASPQTLSQLVTYTHYVKVPKQQMLVWLNSNYQLGDGNISLLYSDVSKDPNNFVYLVNEYAGWRGQAITGFAYGQSNGQNQTMYANGFCKPLSTMAGVQCQAPVSVVLGDKTWEQLVQLYTNSNVYSQDTFINQINEGASIIDDKLYEELRVMLGSEDTNNYPMALEIMASSNLNHSVYNIIRLLREFKATIYNCKERNHVNFKSLLEYLGIKDKWYHLNDDQMVDILKEQNQLTLEILQPLAEHLKESWKKQVDGKHFQISKITLSEELQEYFKEQHRQRLLKQKMEKECQELEH